MYSKIKYLLRVLIFKVLYKIVLVKLAIMIQPIYYSKHFGREVYKKKGMFNIKYEI